MHVLFKRKILRSGQRHAGGGDAFDCRIVRQVDKHHSAVDGAGLLETLDKEVGFLKRDAHSGKHDRKRFVGAAHLGLARNLRCQICVRQAAGGKNREFLAAHQCIQSVDGGNSRLDKLLGIVARRRVHGQAVDVQALLRKDLRPSVDRAAQAVKDTAEHVLGEHAI